MSAEHDAFRPFLSGVSSSSIYRTGFFAHLLTEHYNAGTSSIQKHGHPSRGRVRILSCRNREKRIFFEWDALTPFEYWCSVDNSPKMIFLPLYALHALARVDSQAIRSWIFYSRCKKRRRKVTVICHPNVFGNGGRDGGFSNPEQVWRISGATNFNDFQAARGHQRKKSMPLLRINT